MSDDTEMRSESDGGSPALGPLRADDRLVTEQIENIMDSRLRPNPVPSRKKQGKAETRRKDKISSRTRRKARETQLAMRPALIKDVRIPPLPGRLKEEEMPEVKSEEEHEPKLEQIPTAQDHVKLERDSEEPQDAKEERTANKKNKQHVPRMKHRLRMKIGESIPDTHERGRFYREHHNDDEETIIKALEGYKQEEQETKTERRIRVAKAIPDSHERFQFYKTHTTNSGYDQETIDRYVEGLRQTDTALRVIALYGSPNVGAVGVTTAMDDYEAEDADNFADIEMEIGPY